MFQLLEDEIVIIRYTCKDGDLIFDSRQLSDAVLQLQQERNYNMTSIASWSKTLRICVLIIDVKVVRHCWIPSVDAETIKLDLSLHGFDRIRRWK